MFGVKMNKALILAVIVIAILATTVTATHYAMHTCAISTGHGLLDDLNCNGIPDIEETNSDNDSQQTQTNIEQDNVKQADNGLADLNVKVVEIQDVIIGGPGAVYPIKIENNADSGKRVFLDVEGIQFGTYRIDPGNVLVLDAGEEKTAYVHVLADEGEGQYTFNLNVEAGDDSKTIILTANLLQYEKSRDWQEVGELLGWIIVALAAILLGYLIQRDYQARKPKKPKKKDEEIYSYY